MASTINIGTNSSQPANPAAGKVKIWIDSSADLNILESDGTNTTISGASGTGDMVAANNLSDLTNVATARTNLGLGSIATLSSPLPAVNGGTGQTGYVVGDMLYANTSSTLAKLAGVATGSALISGGVGVAPSYGKIGLTTHVSGILPITNGGTGAITAGAARSNLGVVASTNSVSLSNNWSGTLSIVTDYNRNVHLYGYVTCLSASSDTVATLPLGNIPDNETPFVVGTSEDGYSLNGYITAGGSVVVVRSALGNPATYINVRFIAGV